MTRRVLVVEDEAIAAMAIRLMLESLDWSVIGVASSGQDAIDLAAQHHPDVVLMDVRLKGDMSGIVSATTIKAQLHIPVVFTTAYSAEELRSTSQVEDNFLFITKPIREDELARTLSIACCEQKTFAHDK